MRLLLQINRYHRWLQAGSQSCMVSFSLTTFRYYTINRTEAQDLRLFYTLTTAGWFHAMYAFYLYCRILVLQDALYLSNALQLLHSLRSLRHELDGLSRLPSKANNHRLLRRCFCRLQILYRIFCESRVYFNFVFGLAFFVAFFSSCFLLFALVHFKTNTVEKSILVCCCVMLSTVYKVLPALINSSIQIAVSLFNDPFLHKTAVFPALVIQKFDQV